MLEVNNTTDKNCLSCGERVPVQEVKINRNGGVYKGQNIITLNLCNKCLCQLARDFRPYS